MLRVVGTMCAGLFVAIALVMGCGSKANERADARVAAPVDAAGAPSKVAAPSGPPKKIYAKRFVVTVRVRPDANATRLGYLRGGAIMQARTAEPVERGHEGCLGGWWELETGGFVCNVRDVVAFTGRRPPERPPMPTDRDAQLPYQYGLNRRDNTPMYRRLPTDDEAAKFEGYRPPGLVAEEPTPAAESDPSASTASLPVAGPDATAVAAAEPAQAPVIEASDLVAPASDEPVDAGPPTLESLRGDREGALLRRMVKGFYVSLDHDVRVRDRRYWRTQSNGFIPYARLSLVNGSRFHGTELDGQTWDLPAAFIMNETTSSYRRSGDGRVRRGARAAFHQVFHIVSEEDIGGHHFFVMQDGSLFRSDDVRRIDRVTPPGNLAENEKWIDVDLERQSLVAYEGARPVYVTLVSSGRIEDEDDPLRNHATPTGDFRITSKHVATTMDGDHAVDGPYSIEDVPYVMYFQLAYALHSAFWHNRFGFTKSHGCVNLSPTDARFLFGWTLPAVPLGWHGAYPTPDVPGTRLIIHGEAPHR
ncbi:MAG: L,D-transpeptidase [Sandaracinaceae bacterium]|nr:L,D-transpeptidase [Sandaracinaceae bacterium]